ncbi:hypothetical protein EYD45_15420 [Hyunsoonleella flava]|uniref:Outer membrane protein beta-barrel domain-containing protein n=1 Tax=Hyunsoonleella flava TaxID=2527939 RepID=A0A4Q9FGG9_9FLAO|nr:hypothetical protein [Hyunsoonleella flava]TBM99347.1 hypothetical protein EYD45_15420 [Hyunsoonleella flava]
MGDKKHIDRLFQERFKDFEVQPDDAVWDKIESKLNNKKKRRVIPIWWRYAGVAALLLLMFTIGKSFFSDESTQDITPQIVDTEKTDTENNINDNLQNNDNTNVEDKNSAVAIDNTDVEASETERNSQENNMQPKAKDNRVEETQKNIIPNKQSSSVATIKTTKKAVERTLEKSSKDNNPAIITYKDHIPKNEVANTNSKEENLTKKNASGKLKSQIISENPTSTQNQTTIALDNLNSKEKTTELNEKTNATQVVKNDAKEEKESIEDAINKNKSLLEEEKTKVAAVNKWSIAPNAAPVYFSSLGKGSSMGEQFANNSKSGEVNMSFGINASYAINDRLTVRSGVNRVNLGYNTNDVVAFNTINASVSARTLNTLSSNVTENVADASTLNVGDDVVIMSATTFKSSSIADFETTNTSINQSFGFIEVPLELQYALSKKRFGVNVIGGFSSLFLNNYEAFSMVEGQRTSVEGSDNINNTSYSANFGLGLNYKVSEKINLNLEPMFKYQINTFRNTSGDFQPFFIGVYTGFGIKF